MLGSLVATHVDSVTCLVRVNGPIEILNTVGEVILAATMLADGNRRLQRQVSKAFVYCERRV